MAIAKTAQSKKAKGTRLEKYIAERIRKILGKHGIEARRMPMSGAMAHFKSDIYTNLPISIEAKNQEKWNIPKWWEQCTKDATSGKMPILIISRNYMNDPLAVIRFEDLLLFMDYAVENGWVSYIRTGRVTKK